MGSPLCLDTEGAYHGQVCGGGTHLVLLVLAVLAICFAICVCIVVPVVHLVLLVLAALIICIGYMRMVHTT